jgi:hypothetical protein
VGEVRRRQHEGRLREIELGGDRLHLLAREAAGVAHHRERIAAEPAAGEHIDGRELDLHGRSPVSATCELGT